MGVKGVLKNRWFLAGTFLTLSAAGIFGYTWYQRQATEQHVKDRLQAYSRLLDLLRSIQNEASLEAAWPELLAFEKEGRNLEYRAKEVLTPSANLKEELALRYGPKLQAILVEIQKQGPRIEKLPGGAAFWEKVETLREKTGLSPVIQDILP